MSLYRGLESKTVASKGSTCYFIPPRRSCFYSKRLKHKPLDRYQIDGRIQCGSQKNPLNVGADPDQGGGGESKISPLSLTLSDIMLEEQLYNMNFDSFFSYCPSWVQQFAPTLWQSTQQNQQSALWNLIKIASFPLKEHKRSLFHNHI